MLQAAGQYRETKASMYRAPESYAAEPEYVPWTGNVCSSSIRAKASLNCVYNLGLGFVKVPVDVDYIINTFAVTSSFLQHQAVLEVFAPSFPASMT